MDQMISGQLGLVLQISGCLARSKVNGATIYTDHHSDFIYLHLMQFMSGEETLQSKQVCNRVAATKGCCSTWSSHKCWCAPLEWHHGE
eukprot:1695199-Ditylum_brightwellii.AAC.1